MKDRIKTVMESNHMTQKIFAQFTGISEGSLSGVLNSKTKPTLMMVDAIHEHFPQVSLEWLLYGIGPMKVDDADAAQADTSGAGGSQGALGTSGSLAGMSAAPGVGQASPQSGGVASSPLLFDVQQAPADARYSADRAGAAQTQIKYVDKPQRRITEIRIFYDDQTWETFTPKK